MRKPLALFLAYGGVALVSANIFGVKPSLNHTPQSQYYFAPYEVKPLEFLDIPEIRPLRPFNKEIQGSRNYARLQMSRFNWGEAQYKCLDELWHRESGWNHYADNPNSSAYGIPQALPGSKMASEGEDWETNYRTQIRWGLRYIESRYSNPCSAWQHFTKKNWY